MNRYITFPLTREEQQKTKEFHELAGMPNVLGAIDGTLINIVAPTEDENIYGQGFDQACHDAQTV